MSEGAKMEAKLEPSLRAAIEAATWRQVDATLREIDVSEGEVNREQVSKLCVAIAAANVAAVFAILGLAP